MPDYTRPLLKIPAAFRERISGRLALLYGLREAEHWLPELERILKVHQAHRPPEMIEKERHFDPRERFYQEHILLINYEAQGKSLYLTLPPYGRIWLKGKP